MIVSVSHFSSKTAKPSPLDLRSTVALLLWSVVCDSKLKVFIENVKLIWSLINQNNAKIKIIKLYFAYLWLPQYFFVYNWS